MHDVFAFRGVPAAWKEELALTSRASWRPATEDERRKLRRIGDEPVVATLTLTEGGTLDIAARPENRDALLGPFATAVGPSQHSGERSLALTDDHAGSGRLT